MNEVEKSREDLSHPERSMKMSIKDTLFGSGLKGTIKGAVEGTIFAGAIPLFDLDISKPEGKLSALIAAWRFLYGLFRK